MQKHQCYTPACYCHARNCGYKCTHWSENVFFYYHLLVVFANGHLTRQLLKTICTQVSEAGCFKMVLGLSFPLVVWVLQLMSCQFSNTNHNNHGKSMVIEKTAYVCKNCCHSVGAGQIQPDYIPATTAAGATQMLHRLALRKMKNAMSASSQKVVSWLWLGSGRLNYEGIFLKMLVNNFSAEIRGPTVSI